MGDVHLLNSDASTHQYKRTYMEVRDGLIFAAGYYILNSRVQTIAYGQVLEYTNKGMAAALVALDTIPAEPVQTYAFVADPETGDTLAQNVDPDLTGMADWDAIVSSLSATDILEDLETEPGVWATYTHTNPVTGDEENKRTWLIMHDGLVFGSGYYLDTSQ